MRWFARRLVFYVFAIWVALTINFLLPRLMPGDPIGGVLQHLSSAQISSNPGIIKTYQALLGGGHHSIWSDYVTYLAPDLPLRLRHLDLELPDAGVRGRRAGRCRTRSSSSASRSCSHSSIGIDDRHGRGLAARRLVDSIVVPRLHDGQRVPRVLPRPSRPLLPRHQGRLVPAPARLCLGRHARLQLAVPLQRVPPLAVADPRHHGGLRRRLGPQHAHGDDQHDRRGLRGHGARQGPERPARDDALCGTQRDPPAAQRLRRSVRERGRRTRLRRDRVQLPGRRLHAAAGRARQRLSARAGDARWCSRSA